MMPGGSFSLREVGSAMNDEPKLHWLLSSVWLMQALFLMFLACVLLCGVFFSPAVKNNPQRAWEIRAILVTFAALFTWKGLKTFSYWRATKA
jgi:hypothetical protein